MELYEAINKRRTVRELLNKEVDFEAVKRILEAGNMAPAWNHNRNWQYIVLDAGLQAPTRTSASRCR